MFEADVVAKVAAQPFAPCREVSAGLDKRTADIGVDHRPQHLFLA
jgi:hypothetical protein